MTCCRRSGNFWTMVTGWPEVNDTPYIGAVVLYFVLHSRLPGAEHEGDPGLEGRRWGWNSDIKLRPAPAICFQNFNHVFISSAVIDLVALPGRCNNSSSPEKWLAASCIRMRVFRVSIGSTSFDERPFLSVVLNMWSIAALYVKYNQFVIFYLNTIFYLN